MGGSDKGLCDSVDYSHYMPWGAGLRESVSACVLWRDEDISFRTLSAPPTFRLPRASRATPRDSGAGRTPHGRWRGETREDTHWREGPLARHESYLIPDSRVGWSSIFPISKLQDVGS